MRRESSPTRRTAACVTEKHPHCPHRIRLGGYIDRGSSGTARVELCHCPCHVLCSLGGFDTASVSEWRLSCTCSGARRLREEEDRLLGQQRTKPIPDYRDGMWSIRDRTAARNEAIDAVLARAAGKDRQEIRELLIEELRRRSVDVPSDQILKADVDFIMKGGGLLPAIRNVLQAIGGIRAARRQVMTMLEEAEEHRGLTGKDAYFVPPDHSLPMIDVILEPMANQMLGRFHDKLLVSLIAEINNQRIFEVAIYLDESRIGILSEQDGLMYKSALDAAAGEGRTLTVVGRIMRLHDNDARVQIYPAGIL